MAHLHTLNIVHRDLKSDNCLCDADLNTKVADFGASKLMQAAKAGGGVVTTTFVGAVVPGQNATATMTKNSGTPLWMAPEVFAGSSHYGPEVDVYSFGIIMWELLTRRQPWDEIEAAEYIVFYAALCDKLETGQRPAVDPADATQHKQYVSMMQKCWAGEPSARPSFEMVMFAFDL